MKNLEREHIQTGLGKIGFQEIITPSEERPCRQNGQTAQLVDFGVLRDVRTEDYRVESDGRKQSGRQRKCKGGGRQDDPVAGNTIASPVEHT